MPNSLLYAVGFFTDGLHAALIDKGHQQLAVRSLHLVAPPCIHFLNLVVDSENQDVHLARPSIGSRLASRNCHCYTSFDTMTELIWDEKYKDGKKQGPV